MKDQDLKLGYAIWKGNEGFFHLPSDQIKKEVYVNVKKKELLGKNNDVVKLTVELKTYNSKKVGRICQDSEDFGFITFKAKDGSRNLDSIFEIYAKTKDVASSSMVHCPISMFAYLGLENGKTKYC